MMKLLLSYGIAFVSSFLLTRAIFPLAFAYDWLAIPNARSSHTAPTPWGGGLAMALVLLGEFAFLYKYAYLDITSFYAYGIGFCIAFMGFFDDKYGLPTSFRFIVHLGVAGIIVSLLFPFTFTWVGIFLAILSVGYIAWILNLYNFMDGIDGLAAMECVSVSFGMAFLYQVQGLSQAIYPLLAMGVVALGFLVWNFPPARIFMGNTGSGVLGIFLGIASLQGWLLTPKLGVGWLIMLAFFISDASITLLRRIFQGQAFWQAHRSHAYQHAALFFGDHRKVVLSVLAMNVLWLFPLAGLVAENHLSIWLGLLFAYVPLCGIVLYFDGGGKPLQKEM